MTDLFEQRPRARRNMPPLRNGAKPWTDAERLQAIAWREQEPPVPFRAIGARLGRSGESVRQQFIYDRVREARPAKHEPGFSRAARYDYAPEFIENRDADLIRMNRRDGGFSAHSTFYIKRKVQGSVIGFCHPLVGAFGIPRPQGWKDGAEVTTDTATDHVAHLAELSRRWRADDVANFQLQPLTEED